MKLYAACAALLLAPAARAQSLDGAVAPAIANARRATASQKRLAQVAAADAPANAGPQDDEELKLALRDIALKACSGAQVSAEELDLPRPSNANFLDGRLPSGLSFGSCAGKLYLSLGLKLAGGDRLTARDVAVSELPLQPAGQSGLNIPAAPAPAPAPAPAAPAPAAPAPALPAPPSSAPAGPSGEEIARRSLEQQNRELQKYDRIIRRSDERRRDRDRDGDRDRGRRH